MYFDVADGDRKLSVVRVLCVAGARLPGAVGANLKLVVAGVGQPGGHLGAQFEPALADEREGAEPLAVQAKFEAERTRREVGHVRGEVEPDAAQRGRAEADSPAATHPARDRGKHVRLVPAFVELGGAVEAEGARPVEGTRLFGGRAAGRPRRKECGAVAVFVVETAQGRAGGFQQEVEAALGETDGEG